jgi:nucleoside-diphosphate-sugar epimerase
MATFPSKQSPKDSFKVVITGMTGFVGSHVIKACLARKEISDIVILSRRELSSDLNPGEGRTLKVIIHEDSSRSIPMIP